MKPTITLLGKPCSRKQLQQLINQILKPVLPIYNQVYEALQHGIPPKAAYNLPHHQLAPLKRYERALQLYDEYKRHYNTARADYILTPAKPSHPQHITRFYCGTTSDKSQHIYTKYCVILARHKRKLHLICDCPDFVNRGDKFPCKHIMLVCMWLRDYLEGFNR